MPSNHEFGRAKEALSYDRHYRDAETFLKNSPEWVQRAHAAILDECRVELEFFEQGDQARMPSGGRQRTPVPFEALKAKYAAYIAEAVRTALPNRLHEASDRLAKKAVAEEMGHASRAAVITSG